jgi:hypothetical protein
MHQDTAGSQQAKAGAKSHALSTEATQVAELSEQLGQLIMPLRGFREHLVSCDRVDSQLGVEAYELSVDVCAAAGRAAASELLKPLQALAGGMYERAAAAAAATGSRPGSGRKHPEIHWQPQPWQGQTRTSAQPHCRADIATARQDSGLTGANTSPDVMSNTSGSGSSAAPGANSTDPAQHGPPAWAARAPEMQAGLLLFFAGSAAGGSAGSRAELVSLLSAFASGPHWQSPILQWALQVCVALTTGNFAAACKLRGCVPPSSAPAGSQLPSRLLSELLDAQLVQVRVVAGVLATRVPFVTQGMLAPIAIVGRTGCTADKVAWESKFLMLSSLAARHLTTFVCTAAPVCRSHSMQCAPLQPPIVPCLCKEQLSY